MYKHLLVITLIAAMVIMAPAAGLTIDSKEQTVTKVYEPATKTVTLSATDTANKTTPTPTPTPVYNYSAYAPDTYDNVTVNVTRWHHIEDSGFIPWYLWLIVFLSGLALFRWSMKMSETADVPAILAAIFLWTAAGTASFIEFYQTSIIDTLLDTGMHVVVVIPVSGHFHPVWWSFAIMALAVIATLHAIRVSFIWMKQAGAEIDKHENDRRL